MAIEGHLITQEATITVYSNPCEAPRKRIVKRKYTDILINGQFPGTTIDAVTNDNVINKLDEPFLITRDKFVKKVEVMNPIVLDDY
ncbi:L-ascorbate oxidase-like protein [Senna tora]|uniref:L-ascorbate oxidase-like protein n=1 Tax=Senna tora TaxID=362788 RepID=A0A834VZ07_9FABA|nr:L-ascorbate oxidase-like protein [Senna tora]